MVDPDAPIASIEIAPESPRLETGAALQLEAIVTDASGRPLKNRQIHWASNDTTIAVISSRGLLTAVRPGTADIAASAEGKSSVVRASVIRPPVARVDLSPASATLRRNEELQLNATLRDAAGKQLTDREVTWSTNDPAIVRVDASGKVTALKPGQAEVTARSEGKTGKAEIRVNPGTPARLEIVSGNNQTGTVGARLTESLVVRVTDDGGNPVGGSRVEWKVGAGNGTVEPASVVTDQSGLAGTRWTLGTTPGSNTATASLDAAGPAQFAATAAAGSVARVTIEPGRASFSALGDTAHLRGATFDQFGNRVEIGLTWSSSSGAATVNGAGLVTARANGSAKIILRAGTIADTTDITVKQVVSRLQVSPASATISSGETRQLSAVAFDANGHPVGDASPTWSSTASTVASVTGSGLITGRQPGNANIIAAVGSVRDTAAVVVTSGAAAAIAALSGNDQSGTVGKAVSDPLTVRVTDGGGHPVPGVNVSWSGTGTADPASSTTNTDGRASTRWTLGTTAGQQTLTATAAGLSRSFQATAAADRAADITVSPASHTFASAGATHQFSAVARDQHGNQVADARFTWSSSNPAVVPVDGTGKATSLMAGTAVLTAASEGRTGTASVTVEKAAVASIQLTPESANIAEGTQLQFTATLYDAAGNVLTGRSVQWSSSRPNVASVNSSGLVTALHPGSTDVTATSEGIRQTAEISVNRGKD